VSPLFAKLLSWHLILGISWENTQLVENALEIELKYRLENLQAFQRVEAALLVGAPSKRVHQQNHFFDTKDHLLRQSKIGLRLRQENEEFFLTAKGPVTQSSDGLNPDALAVHAEEEMILSQDRARSMLDGALPAFLPFLEKSDGLLNPQLVAHIEETHHKQPLAYVGRFENVRTRIPKTITLFSGPIDLVFELDQTTFLEKIIHYELEVEVPSRADVAGVDEAVQGLLKQAGVTWTKTPGKASRFFALLGFS
jgi:uncharacterized protein YjbK